VKSMLTLMSIACAAATWPTAADAQTLLPSAGLWDLSLTMEGAPSGAQSRRGSACLTAEALAAAPEQTLFEAAARQGGGGRGPLKCEYGEVKRDGAASLWQSVCEGPMGKMQGTGSGTLAAETAELQQRFAIKAPIGTLNLKQTVSARRVGSC
jgi:Protein of unknown function (DUF3617)